MPDKTPWVKICDDAWDDAIVGNREGLQALKAAIDEALSTGCAEVAGRFESDFGLVALDNSDWPAAKTRAVSNRWGYLLLPALFIWAVVLPLLGLWKIAGAF